MEDAERAAQVTVEVLARRIPAEFGMAPRPDIRVLVPMHRGAAGAGVLNTLLLQALTPTGPDVPERPFGGRIFRVGDKSPRSATTTTSANGVFNGTQGVATAMDLVEQTLTVRTDEGLGRSTTNSADSKN